MNDNTAILECPGCHRRYKRSDMRTDKLVCPACGREVTALVSMNAKDAGRIIKDYVFSLEWVIETVTSVLFFVISAGGLIYSFCCDFIWWVFLSAVFLFAIGVFAACPVYRRYRVFAIFKDAGFDFEKGLAQHRIYLESFENKSDIPDDIGRNLERNLGAKLAAAWKVETSYALPTVDVPSRGVDVPKEMSASGVMTPSPAADGVPTECPSCHSPYKVSDYSGGMVKCRRCGGAVTVENCVDDKEVLRIGREYLLKFRKTQIKELLMSAGIMSVMMVAGAIFWLCADSTASFFRSWPVVLLHMSFAFGAFEIYNFSKKYEICKVLESGTFTLFDIEYAVKKEVVDEAELRDFDEFKGAILALYRAKGTTMKGKVLS